MRTIRVFCTMVFLGVGALSSGAAAGDSYVYVSVAGEKRIAIFSMNAKDGTLAPRDDVSVSGQPGPLAIDPTRRFLFASLRSTGELASFSIDPETGTLSQISVIAVGASATYVSTDRTGKYLLSAYYGAGKVAVHRIRKKGTLKKKPLQSVPTAAKAHAIVLDRSNRFAFVPHTGPNAIFQFQFDAESGQLKANAVPKVTTPDNTGPRHLWFHPAKDFAYVSDEQGSSITAYGFNKQTGRLKALQTLSTLPDGFEKNNSTADIEVAPSGKFVYVANRGHDSIAGFAVDAKTGRLTAIGQALTEQTPRSFNIDPSSRFLYAAGQSSGKVAAFRMDGDTGKLTRFATYNVGKVPSWVLVVALPE